MPSLLDIRRRIRAVKSTQQITKAMKMVAASKLRRAQERIQHARPYAIADAAGVEQPGLARGPGGASAARRAADAEGGRARAVDRDHRRPRPVRQLQHQRHQGRATLPRREPGREVALGLIGRRGRDYFGRRGFEVRYEQVNLFATLKFEDAQAMARPAIDAFIKGEVDSVYLVYNEFKSVMQQKRGRRAPAADSTPGTSTGSRPPRAPAIDYMYEPAPKQILERLIPVTSRSRCSARCSSRPPPNTPRG